ncbi:hypothetical protein Vretifemale_14350 [Volvox reticuliferus]|uniref:Uncharacterized protein n=1 Tax=Volvox reticuliferus TaxID=1737510 RepID=A0A8J4FTY0_9CHLO|nr:hypothetical protein Vretifemale_14350 [Volvox reticuliferus]
MAASNVFWFSIYFWLSSFLLASAAVKNSVSPFLLRFSSSPWKYLSVNDVRSSFGSATFVLVAMTYAAFTRRAGTPFSLKGPVTSKRPDGSWLRKMTLLPLKRPASRIRTVPGVMLARSWVGL